MAARPSAARIDAMASMITRVTIGGTYLVDIVDEAK
jgi:hypothetical protein